MPVLQSIMGHPALVQAYRLDGVITLVDAVNGAATLDAHAEAVKQVAVADRIVISKADLRDRGRPARPDRAAAVDQPDGADSGRGSRRGDAGKPVRQRALGSGDQDRRCAPLAGRGEPSTTIITMAIMTMTITITIITTTTRVKSFSLVHDRPIPYAAIDMFLELLRSVHGDKLLRMKGVIEIAEHPDRPLVVHGVQKLLHPPARLPSWPDGQRGTRLVIIGFDLAGGPCAPAVRRDHQPAGDRPARPGGDGKQPAGHRRYVGTVYSLPRPGCFTGLAVAFALKSAIWATVNGRDGRVSGCRWVGYPPRRNGESSARKPTPRAHARNLARCMSRAGQGPKAENSEAHATAGRQLRPDVCQNEG